LAEVAAVTAVAAAQVATEGDLLVVTPVAVAEAYMVGQVAMMAVAVGEEDPR
jgi:hypothetical protein